MLIMPLFFICVFCNGFCPAVFGFWGLVFFVSRTLITHSRDCCEILVPVFLPSIKKQESSIEQPEDRKFQKTENALWHNSSKQLKQLIVNRQTPENVAAHHAHDVAHQVFCETTPCVIDVPMGLFGEKNICVRKISGIPSKLMLLIVILPSRKQKTWRQKTWS